LFFGIAVNGRLVDGGALVTGGGRDLDQLKQEVQRRADCGMPPLGGIAPEDVRAALSRITSLDREQWALAFSSVADQHRERAQALEARDRAEAAKETTTSSHSGRAPVIAEKVLLPWIKRRLG